MKDRLKQARKRAGLSQRDLAERCGLTQPAISELESGKSASTAYAAQIAAALGVSALWLAAGEGNMLAGAGDAPPPPVKPVAVDPAVIRADAYLDSAITAAEQALQSAMVGNPAGARKVRAALASLRDARVLLASGG